MSRVRMQPVGRFWLVCRAVIVTRAFAVIVARVFAVRIGGTVPKATPIDRPAHAGGYRLFLPPEVLRLGVPDSVKPIAASEPKLCFSLANIWPEWAATQGIFGTTKWHPEIPFNPAPLTEKELHKLRPSIDQALEALKGKARLTAAQRWLVNSYYYIINEQIRQFTGRKPAAPVILSEGARRSFEDKPVSDYQSAGAEALIDAARGFRPSLGYTFATYASDVIGKRIGKVAKGKPKTEPMDQPRSLLDAPRGEDDEDDEGNAINLGDTIPDETPPPPDADDLLELPEEAWAAIRASLSTRELEVLQARLRGHTQEEIAAELKTRRQVVSTIEVRARERARKAIERDDDARKTRLARDAMDSQRALQRLLRYVPGQLSDNEWDEYRHRCEWGLAECFDQYGTWAALDRGDPTRKLTEVRKPFVRDPFDLLTPKPPKPESEAKRKNEDGVVGGNVDNPKLRERNGRYKRGGFLKLNPLTSRNYPHNVEANIARAYHKRKELVGVSLEPRSIWQPPELPGATPARLWAELQFPDRTPLRDALYRLVRSNGPMTERQLVDEAVRCGLVKAGQTAKANIRFLRKSGELPALLSPRRFTVTRWRTFTGTTSRRASFRAAA
jgi:RNA polymerase sigma factor (sigma-70 family)